MRVPLYASPGQGLDGDDAVVVDRLRGYEVRRSQTAEQAGEQDLPSAPTVQPSWIAQKGDIPIRIQSFWGRAGALVKRKLEVNVKTPTLGY